MKFSVIIPTWNRPNELVHCLESFIDLDYSHDAWELIVVNDGGNDSFTEVTAELKQSLPLRLLTINHAGPATARNEGARIAHGGYLAFTDDDCRVTPEWLSRFAQGFAQEDMAALGGHSMTPFVDDPAARAWQHLTNFLYEYMRDIHGNALLLLSNNVAYRRSVFESLGGFDESFPLAAAEDMEMSYRLLAHGYRQIYYPEAKVWHYHRLTPWRLIAQQFRYGRGGYYFRQALRRFPASREIRFHSRKPFSLSLVESLWRAPLPLSIWFLVCIARLAYLCGHGYQTMRAM